MCGNNNNNNNNNNNQFYEMLLLISGVNIDLRRTKVYPCTGTEAVYRPYGP
jgi:hypothetical protein